MSKKLARENVYLTASDYDYTQPFFATLRVFPDKENQYRVAFKMPANKTKRFLGRADTVDGAWNKAKLKAQKWVDKKARAENEEEKAIERFKEFVENYRE